MNQKAKFGLLALTGTIVLASLVAPISRAAEHSTVWIDGLPYYYANDLYYTWNPAQNGYVVVDKPANSDQPSTPPANVQEDLIIYPKNGQPSEQQAADRYECYRSAKGQTGFDPTQPGLR